jgi:hypothetical protein
MTKFLSYKTSVRTSRKTITVYSESILIIQIYSVGRMQSYSMLWHMVDRLCGLVVRVLGYRSGGPGSIPGTTKKKISSGSGTGSTQPCEYN